MHVDDLLRELPIDRVDLGLRFQIEQAEIERLLRFFFYLLNVVQTFEAIAALETLFRIENVADEFMIFLARRDFQFGRGFLDRAERFHHEHGMVCDNGAPAFAHDRRMRHAFGIAHVGDVPNNVIRIFLKGIIRRTVEIAARSVVVDPESAADIEITEIVSEFCEFGVVACGFAHRAFDRGNVGHLRADVKMNELEAMRESSGFQHFARGNETRGVETELRVLSAAGRPFAGAFAVQTDANTDHRLDADFLRRADR